MAVHSNAASAIGPVVRNLLDILQIPDPWPATPPVVEDYINDGYEDSDLNFVQIGPPWRMKPDPRLLPALVVDVESIDTDLERGGADASQKRPKITLTIPVYYLMARSEAEAYDPGDIMSFAGTIAATRLGRLRATLIADDAYKNWDSTVIHYSDCSDPAINNDATTVIEGMNIDTVAAGMVVVAWVAEDPEL